jgi:uncharacterized membrane protein YphA (DoxX/SURF4 family)
MENRTQRLVLFCRLALAVVFIYAAIGKITHPGEFAEAVAAFKLLPIVLVNVFAIILPWIELASGLALLHRVSARHGALLIAGLNLIFMIAAASALARGLDIRCGCFTLSHAHTKLGWSLIARDAAFLALCLPILLHHTRAK